MLDRWPGIDWFIVVHRIEKPHFVGVPANVIDVICCNDGGFISSRRFCKTKFFWSFWLNPDIGKKNYHLFQFRTLCVWIFCPIIPIDVNLINVSTAIKNAKTRLFDDVGTDKWSRLIVGTGEFCSYLMKYSVTVGFSWYWIAVKMFLGCLIDWQKKNCINGPRERVWQRFGWSWTSKFSIFFERFSGNWL